MKDEKSSTNLLKKKKTMISTSLSFPFRELSTFLHAVVSLWKNREILLRKEFHEETRNRISEQNARGLGSSEEQ